MAEVTAAMVKGLRETTGAGMMDCKKALTEAEGDMEKAVEVLREKGLAAAAKKAGKGPCGICKPDEHIKDKTVQCSGKDS